MTFVRRMLAFVVVMTAALMAVNEFPELLTLTDNSSNDYVSVRTASESSHLTSSREPTHEVAAAPAAFSGLVRLRAATGNNFLHSPAAKSPRGLLQLLVTQRN